MAILDSSNATTTDLSNQVSDFIVESKRLDIQSPSGETYWYFADATKNLGYYFTIPELKSAIDSLAIWAVGKGWVVQDPKTKVILEHLTGNGKDIFDSIIWNLEVIKKVVGDSFAEIIKKDTLLINLKPISPERVRIVYNSDGQITRYDVWNGKKWKPIKKESMLHLINDRIGDQLHGTSVVDATKWIIDAKNEAMRDERMIKHRELALGVLYIDSDNTTKRDAIMKQYAQAVKNGEVLVLPKDTAELKDTNISPKDRLEWIRYLEGFFYQTVRVPRSIATSDGVSEVGGKMGHVIFEPIYTKEQTDIEGSIWNQLGIKIKFNRPPSLGGLVQEEEAKNTGQIGIQPNDVEASMTRE